MRPRAWAAAACAAQCAGAVLAPRACRPRAGCPWQWALADVYLWYTGMVERRQAGMGGCGGGMARGPEEAVKRRIKPSQRHAERMCAAWPRRFTRKRMGQGSKGANDEWHKACARGAFKRLTVAGCVSALCISARGGGGVGGWGRSGHSWAARSSEARGRGEWMVPRDSAGECARRGAACSEEPGGAWELWSFWSRGWWWVGRGGPSHCSGGGGRRRPPGMAPAKPRTTAREAGGGESVSLSNCTRLVCVMGSGMGGQEKGCSGDAKCKMQHTSHSIQACCWVLVVQREGARGAPA